MKDMRRIGPDLMKMEQMKNKIAFYIDDKTRKELYSYAKNNKTKVSKIIRRLILDLLKGVA